MAETVLDILVAGVADQAPAAAGAEKHLPLLQVEALQDTGQEAVGVEDLPGVGRQAGHVQAQAAAAFPGQGGGGSSREPVSMARLLQLPSKLRVSAPDLFFRENSRPPRLSSANCIAWLSSYS